MKCFQRKGKHIANNITFERIPFIALRRSRGRPAPQSTVTEIYVCIEVRFFAPFGASLVDQTSPSELHERAGDPGRREPPTGGAWSSGMYTCMPETIPVSIHAVCVVNTPYTTCFRCARQCRQWYEPPRLSSHPN